MLTLAEHALIRKDFLEIGVPRWRARTLIAVPIGLVVVVPALFLAAVCLVAVGTSRWNPGDAFAPAFPFTAL